MFATDYIRVCNKLNPIYVIDEVINNKHYYYGVFYKIEEEYAIGASGMPITSVIRVRMYLFNKQIMQRDI